MKCLLHATATAVALTVMLGSAQSQVLFTYGKKPVTKTEFLQAFNKNPNSGNRLQAMKEYLPLYQHYKLKVQDAYDHKMDTIASHQQELYAYQEQLTESFLAKQSNADGLVKEAFIRSQKDKYISHFAIPFTPGDTASQRFASGQATKAYQELKKGQPFAEVVNRYSHDAEVKANHGLVGWVTVFTLPAVYEDAIYNTTSGSYTEPVKGSDAYHIFYVQKERKAVGKVKVAQILLLRINDGDAAEDTRVAKLADSIYQLVTHGMAFDQAALQFSTDRTSYAVGGELPEFGVAEYDARFEQEAFALQQTGAISKPFRTSHGWHILKLLKKTPPATSMDDEAAVAAIKQQVVSTERLARAEQTFLSKNLKQMKFVQAPFQKEELWRYTDSALRRGNTSQFKLKPATLLFSLGKEKTLVENWVMYNRAVGLAMNMDYEKRWENYIIQSANTYYKQHIAEFEPSYKAQVKEFKDANLLFAAMEKNVWEKAANDAAGLEKYYAAQKQRYKWNDGATALMITASDSATANAFSKKLAADPQQWRKVADEFRDGVIADSARYESNQLPLAAGQSISPNTITPLVKNPLDNSYSFTYIFAKLAGGDIRSFEDAKGWVIGDYQQVLEANWMAELKKKYPIVLNEAVWQQTLKVN
ncbi:MAG TPA: peptidylprolyl isomerase [Phnomibacter sp.]|nr:peptidylprolyl isomerase [Phnomibacter sp.]